MQSRYDKAFVFALSVSMGVALWGARTLSSDTIEKPFEELCERLSEKVSFPSIETKIDPMNNRDVDVVSYGPGNSSVNNLTINSLNRSNDFINLSYSAKDIDGLLGVTVQIGTGIYCADHSDFDVNEHDKRGYRVGLTTKLSLPKRCFRSLGEGVHDIPLIIRDYDGNTNSPNKFTVKISNTSR